MSADNAVALASITKNLNNIDLQKEARVMFLNFSQSATFVSKSTSSLSQTFKILLTEASESKQDPESD